MMLRPEVQAQIDDVRATMARLRATIEARESAAIEAKVNWPSAQRPRWWGEKALRQFVTASHREMTITQCCAEAEQRFARTVSRSSLQRYWALLDQAKAQRAQVMKSEQEAA